MHLKTIISKNLKIKFWEYKTGKAQPLSSLHAAAETRVPSDAKNNCRGNEQMGRTCAEKVRRELED